MALLYSATVTPTKPELLASWLPGQPWLDGADVTSLTPIGSYRFDDPDGEVGVETFLVRSADGRVLQAVFTYRAAPLEGAEHALVGTTEHSVLGTRWVYDGCADPVYATTLAATILRGGSEAALELERDGERITREPSVRVSGSGNPAADAPTAREVSVRPDGVVTLIVGGDLELAVLRVLDVGVDAGDAATLTGTWDGSDEPTLLAFAR